MTISITAIHESAHAVVAMYFNLKVHNVQVQGDDGYVVYSGPATPYQRAVIAFAGYYAEVLYGEEDTNWYAYRFMVDRATVEDTDYTLEELMDALDIIFESEWVRILDLAATL